MRIVSVTHYFPAYGGGIEAVALELNRRLGLAGNEVYWFASRTEQLPEPSPGLFLQPMLAIHLLERLLGLPLPIWIFPDIRRLWSAIERCDVVHVHDYIYPGSLIALAAAARYGKPVVITQHIGMVPYDSLVLTRLLQAVNRTIGKWALAKADQVVFISDAVRAFFSDFCRFSRKPLLIPNGVDHEIFSPIRISPESARTELGLNPDAPVCLFVGRFVEKKGLHLLRPVVASTPEIQWLFAGSGPLDPSKWGLSNAHVFSGLSRQTLAPLFQAADLLVLPSRGEGFPLVIQEAFACGVPALTTPETASGLAEASSILFSCSVDGPDPSVRWPETIRSILRDREGRARRATDALAYSRQHWSWQTCVRRYIRIYSDLSGVAAIESGS